MSRDDHAVQKKKELIELWRPKRRQNIVTALTTLPQGWVSSHKQQCTTAITMMGTESLCAFPESYTADDSWVVHSSNGDQQNTKVLRTPQPRWELLYFWVNTRRRSRWCSQNLHRPFSVRQRSQRCGQNLHGPFLRAILPMTVGLGTWATAGSRETKGLITPPPRWVSAQLLYIWGSARRLSQWWSHNLHRPSCKRWGFFNYITFNTLHSAIFFTIQAASTSNF